MIDIISISIPNNLSIYYGAGDDRRGRPGREGRRQPGRLPQDHEENRSLLRYICIV